jgi:Fe-S cluster biogenesis protein NfuA
MYTVTGRCKKGNPLAHFEITPQLEGVQNQTFANIDEAQNAPLVQQLFYLPFVKKVSLSSAALQVERFNILEWEEVIDEVALQIQNYLNDGGAIVKQQAATKKVPVTVYAESTPNPAVMKFVVNKLLVETIQEFKDLDEAQNAPLATALFQFPFVKEIFMDANYLSLTKYESIEWDSVVMETREFIRDYIQEGNPIVKSVIPHETSTATATPKSLSATEQEIVRILDEYIKPAVASDGGNIAFDSYETTDKTVRVILQGACSGCPSSTLTLKNGIENMLKEMLPGKVSTVEALNG